MSQYKTTPELTEKMPPGVPYIVGNELAERFSYYGMRAILYAFMTKHLLDANGDPAVMSQPVATSINHLFISSSYLLGIIGALIADGWLGKYRTIIWLSLVYCAGHVALAVDETRVGLYLGLTLIAIGAGGIKPCVSAHVGDQFGAKNQHLLPRVFNWFYFSINFGAAFSTLLTPFLLHWQHGGPWLAFGVPGVLMFLATIVFWLGRNQFVHVPPGGLGFVKEAFSRQGLRDLGRIALIFLFVVPFWAIFDQTSSSWVAQAEKMDRRLQFWNGAVWEVEAEQIQAVNPFLIMLFVPLFAFAIYPAMGKIFAPTPLRKMAIGFFVAALAFLISTWLEIRIEAGEVPHMYWQVFAYAVLTFSEVLVSITCLEFAYTQAPPKMKSFVMATYLASVALGNFLVAAVNAAIAAFSPPSESGEPMLLEGAAYYWLFTGMMFVTALLFLVVLWLYKPKTYIQGEKEELASGGR